MAEMDPVHFATIPLPLIVMVVGMIAWIIVIGLLPEGIQAVYLLLIYGSALVLKNRLNDGPYM